MGEVGEEEEGNGEVGEGEGERSDITTCAIAYVVLLLH